MAEYYALLTKAVAGLENNTHEARRAIYDKARHALVVQLKAINPPLTPSEISRQRLELEEAVRKVERESQAAVNSNRADISASTARAMEAALAQRTRSEEKPPAPVREEPVAAEAAPSRRSTAEASPAAARPGGIDRRPLVPREPLQERPAPARPAEPAAASVAAAADTLTEIEDEPEEAAPPPREPVRPAARAPEPPREEEQPEPEPVREPVRARPAPTPPPPPPPVAEDWDEEPEAAEVDDETIAALTGDRPARGRKARAEKRAPKRPEAPNGYYEQAAKPSRLPSVIMIVLIVAVLGAIGAVGWTYRANISDLIASFDQSGQEGAEVAEAPAAGAPLAPKVDDRLLSTPPAADNSVRALGAPDGAAPAGNASVPLGPIPGEEDGLAAADQEPDAPVDEVPPPVIAQNEPAPGAQPGIAVAQKAILYEEPLGADAGAQVIALEGAVTWRYVDSGPDGPLVEAHLEVPERNLKITMTVKRNLDSQLPASHMIEILVEMPPDYAGGGVNSIPRLVLKPTEQSRGQPLVGQAIQVTSGFFWIALSNQPAETQANLGLLKERNWIDLPLLYANGQRAILTFEKGAPGERAFAQALAAWGS